MDSDCLIHAGSGIDQVTWMDVRVGDWVVTPRHGKPVEINALWYNALQVMSELAQYFEEEDPYKDLAEQVARSFVAEFWNEKKQCLYDVVDNNLKDDSIRPNQIYAVSLPYTILPEGKAKAVVTTVERELVAGRDSALFREITKIIIQSTAVVSQKGMPLTTRELPGGI